ncbi:MAG: Fe-S-cluster-containing hydrogenase [Bacteroidota bacterium]|jgi:Fe-S-cluster-containing dehydrogenase component
MSDRSLHASTNPMWKSIDELAEGRGETAEFAPGTTTSALADSGVSRRSFMALVSASMALTAAACRRPEQKLVPSVKSLQNATPGLPIYYASVYSHRNVAYGAVVKTREGRPIKVTGNASHPGLARGAANAEMQASLLSLYDPDRIRRPKVGGQQTSFDAAASKMAGAINEAITAGKKVALFVDEHCSPTYTQLLNEFVAAVPNAVVVTLPAIINDGAAIANKAVFGRDAQIVPDLSQASVIVSVDADFLGADTLALYNATRFAGKRTPSKANAEMSHLTVVESQYSSTGMNADVRVRTAPSQIEGFLQDLHAAVVGGATSSNAAVSAAAKRLKSAAAGTGVVLVGAHLSAHAHGLGIAINSALGSVGAGKIIDASRTLPNSGEKGAAIADITSQMEAGAIHAAIFLDVNPEYSASRAFKNAILKKVAFRGTINLYDDETSQISDASIPAAHWLESWGTAVSPDGYVSIQQPVIAPLCDGIPSLQDTLMTVGKKVNAAFLGATTSYADYVKGAMMAAYPAMSWVDTLQSGVVAGTGRTASDLPMNAGAISGLSKASVTTGTVLLTVPSNALYDGRLANNAWLQELPDPVTKVTWDNVALISPAMAVKLGLASSTEDLKALSKANENVVAITTKEGSVELPVLVQPGMADDTIATQLGYGRTAGGSIGTGIGANAFVAGTCGYHAVESVSVTGARHRIATTQNHHTLSETPGDTQNERNVAQTLKLSDLASVTSLEPDYIKDEAGKPLSIVGEYQYKGHRWGMVIDMSSCTGCSSCVIACQSENNIPVVGKDQVLLGREMHWIRLDRYYSGSLQDPSSTVIEPMLCQHCENAPCENVCPVAATTHSPEGLNEMTYNRCVGTRYCLNNCPYKVRRFNFLNYKDERQPLDLVFNPEVSGRMRGIMEKCTFCVQRLHEAKWHARDEGRARVKDGEAITACQEACPAGAIIFGDANDAASRVSVARKSERSFHVLAEINTRPSVTYLAKVINDRA